MRFVHITDLHLADKPFGNHKDFIQDELWKQLEEVFDICFKENRDLIITGDVFEHPRPSMVSHNLVTKLINYFNEFKHNNLDVLCIAGNHDLGPGGMEFINEQPLGSVFAGTDLYWNTSPYMHGEVEVHYKNYEPRGEFDPDFFKANPYYDGAKRHMVLAHGMLVPDNFSLPYPHVTHSQIADPMVDLVLYGHHHDYHGIHQVGNTVFANLGSFCRRSRNQQRDVFALVGELSEKGLELEERKLKSASPWQEIFKEEEVTQENYSQEYVSIANEAKGLLGGHEVDFRSILEEMRGKTPKPIIDKTEEYLVNAEQRINSK